jgi:signal recognition particle GTPase
LGIDPDRACDERDGDEAAEALNKPMKQFDETSKLMKMMDDKSRMKAMMQRMQQAQGMRR